jgi:poly(A) polymerase
VRVDGDWRSRPGTQAVLTSLAAAGFRALFVGGCVRNALLGQPVADIDVATDAEPTDVMRLAGAAGLKTVPTGIAHGTVTVIAGGVVHEVTTFRRDVETFGRHARVAFSRRHEDHAGRRDFTMNALYAEADGTVVDPLGGLGDALARRVRFVGDATLRIREDTLRILRFFRFNAWYGDAALGIDADGLAACAAEVEGLDGLSRERVGGEMLKLLAAPDPAPAVAALAATGGLARVLPGSDPRPLPVLVAHEQALGVPGDALRRLACLGGETRGLRLSRVQERHLAQLHKAFGAGPGEAAYRYGAAVALDAALVAAASAGSALPPALEASITRGAAARFPVEARDFLPSLDGPALGRRLKALEARWIGSDFRLTREDLLADDSGE